MFGNKKENISTPIGTEQEVTKGEEQKIYTMPEKFTVREEKKPASNLYIVVLTVLILLVVIGGGTYVFYKAVKPPSAQIAKVENVNLEVKPPVEVNKNENINVNENKNVNANVNANANANINAEIPPIFAGMPVSSLDTDQDGLTDVEEELYGTNPNLADSEGDGHSDGLELINLYNPAAAAPADLKDSAIVNEYYNPIFEYTLLYPAKWVARAIDSANREIMFSSQTGEFIELIVQENPEKLSVLNWYLKQSPNVNPSQVESVVTKNGIRGIKSVDGLTVYLVKPVVSGITGLPEEKQYIYVITYNPGTKSELSFKSTFEMMYNSLQFGKKGEPAKTTQ